MMWATKFPYTFILCVFFGLTMFAPVSEAAIYKCKDASGKLVFKDRPCNPSESNVQPIALAPKSLNGTWQIVAFNGKSEGDNDQWLFDEEFFYQKIEGKTLAPDAYTLSDKKIDLGHAKIDVSTFDGQRMTATMGGAEYHLEKVEESIDTNSSSRNKSSHKPSKEETEFAESIVSALLDGDLKVAALDCAKAVRNSRSGIETMLHAGKRNYNSGHIGQTEYEKGVEELNQAKNSLTESDCKSASGVKKKFYECMSHSHNHIMACGKRYDFD